MFCCVLEISVSFAESHSKRRLESCNFNWFQKPKSIPMINWRVQWTIWQQINYHRICTIEKKMFIVDHCFNLRLQQKKNSQQHNSTSSITSLCCVDSIKSHFHSALICKLLDIRGQHLEKKPYTDIDIDIEGVIFQRTSPAVTCFCVWIEF